MRVKLRPGSPDAEGLCLHPPTPPLAAEGELDTDGVIQVQREGLITGLIGADPGGQTERQRQLGDRSGC